MNSKKMFIIIFLEIMAMFINFFKKIVVFLHANYISCMNNTYREQIH